MCEHAHAAGFARLAKAGKSTVWRILDDSDIKPHKIRYYLEKRDPEFDRKMQEVLMVYRDVSLYREGAARDARPNPIYAVSVDEKPGIQAIGLTAPDLPPVPGKAATVGQPNGWCLQLFFRPSAQKIQFGVGILQVARLNFGSSNALGDVVGSPSTVIWEPLGFGCANNWRRERTYFNWGEK